MDRFGGPAKHTARQRDESSTGKPGAQHPTPRCGGEQGPEPHGREWMKYSTESGGDQAVKVVRNDAGGTKRAWNPATR